MNTFENLSKTEQEEFLKFPVYISLLAANQDEVYRFCRTVDSLSF